MVTKRSIIIFIVIFIWVILIYPVYIFYSNTYKTKIVKTNVTNQLITQSPSNKSLGAGVMIEFRASNYLVAVVSNIFHNIPSDWKIQLFHGPSNSQFIKNSTLSKFITNGRLILTEMPEYLGGNSNRQSFLNGLLKDVSFWERTLNVEKLLLFQMDTVFCSNSPYKITDFLQWDFVGAPWPDSWMNQTRGVRVGNGGFSLRSRSKTIQLLNTTTDRTITYEDLYFGTNIPRVGGRVAPLEVAKKFSSEGDFYVNSMAIHKPFGNGYDDICRNCPESNLIPPFCRSKPPPYPFAV